MGRTSTSLLVAVLAAVALAAVALAAGADPSRAQAPAPPAAPDSTLAHLDREARAALATGNIAAILAAGEKARLRPPGRGTRHTELVAAIADVRAKDLGAAVARLRAASPAALIGVIAVLALLTVLLGAAIYVPVAVFVWVAGERRRSAELTPIPAGEAGVADDLGLGSGGAQRASWRTPLGLRAGLLLTVADDAIGLFAAFAVAWLAFGAPEAVLSIDTATRAGSFSTLLGTAAGNLGTLLVAAFLYRARGVAAPGAGFAPVSPGSILGVAVLALPLLFLSAGHDLLFTKLLGREPHSNAEPILEVLLGPGGGVLGLAAVILTVAVTAPIVEEVVYRGVVYRAFRDRTGVPLAVLASGFVFSVAHLEVDHLLPLWWIGMVLALVVERTGSIIPAIALHSLYNALSLGAYLSGVGR